MKIIQNKFIPFPGFKLITIFCWIFTKNKALVTEKDCEHEYIHWQQQKELLILLFYLWYIIEYLIKLFITLDHKIAYRSISFEQQAYSNNKKHYGWLQYIFNIVK